MSDLQSGSIDVDNNLPSTTKILTDSDLEATTGQRWMSFLYFMVYLPKWCFGIVGNCLGMDAVEYENTTESDQTSSIVQDHLVENIQPNNGSTKWLPWPFTIFEDLMPSIFTHFPATLTIGPVEQDLSVVSMVLLSTFFACLTSMFMIFLHDLTKNYPKATTLADLLSSKYGSHTEDPDLNDFSSPSKLDPSGPNDYYGGAFGNPRKLTEEDNENGNYLFDCNDANEQFEDCIVLHQFPRGKYSPCFDMQGMRVESMLRLAGINYEIQFDCDNTGPWIQVEDEIIWGYHCIIKFLSQSFRNKFNRFLVSPVHRIQSHLINLHVEHEICWLLYHWRWFYGISCRENNFRWSKVPEEYVELAASSWNRKFGNVNIDCVVGYFDDALNLLSQILGGNQFFIGNKVSELDVCVFAALSQALWAMPTTTIEGLIFTKRNLVDFCIRMRNLCWKDWHKQLSADTGVKNEELVNNSPTDQSELNFGVEIRSELTPQKSRTRTRTCKNSTTLFYCPPDIPSIQVKNEDDGPLSPKNLQEQFMQITGTSRVAKLELEQNSDSSSSGCSPCFTNQLNSTSEFENAEEQFTGEDYRFTELLGKTDCHLMTRKHAEGDQETAVPQLSPRLGSKTVCLSGSLSLNNKPWL